ncbi:hypothetical protein PHPALM_31510 [Phytophthora palmivora]|uniref:Uncharacterized protein n=1 Tax=Phytophthora palmivora TaxID=4796 RepID=A0A2P4X2D2_9STRA|nr:hypothetical protein PHPALM_31510 [Phytophthora palmivora]
MYKEFAVDLSHAQAVKVLHGKPVRLSHSQLNKGHSHYFHPENYKKLVKAYEAGKGTTLHMTHGEVLRTHQSGLSGSGFWGNLWNGIKKGAAWNFLKTNWKPITSRLLDGIATAAGPEATPLHGLVKDASGVGMAPPMTRRRIKVTIGSVYKIVCSQSDICYVGSTFNQLKHRMSGHRTHFKVWDDGKSSKEFAIYPYFRKYGPYEVKIMLIKQYEVVDRAHLHAYELLWINNFKKACVNKVLPFSPLKNKKYWEANKDVLNEKCKRYNELNKERLVEKVSCECGGHYQYRARTYHFKSKKHIRWAEAQSNQ